MTAVRAPALEWYRYQQNNVGGAYILNDSLGQEVWVEAHTAREADLFAEAYLGIYFDGVNNDRDCPCCGDRWHPAGEPGFTMREMIRSFAPDDVRAARFYCYDADPHVAATVYRYWTVGQIRRVMLARERDYSPTVPRSVRELREARRALLSTLAVRSVQLDPARSAIPPHQVHGLFLAFDDDEEAGHGV